MALQNLFRYVPIRSAYAPMRSGEAVALEKSEGVARVPANSAQIAWGPPDPFPLRSYTFRIRSYAFWRGCPTKQTRNHTNVIQVINTSIKHEVPMRSAMILSRSYVESH